MLGETVISTQTIYITMEQSQKMDTYRGHPRHSKLRRYRVGLHGMVGKDVARHQSRPTSRCEERCWEPLLDVVLL
jgi:hypothetical protein